MTERSDALKRAAKITAAEKRVAECVQANIDARVALHRALGAWERSCVALDHARKRK